MSISAAEWEIIQLMYEYNRATDHQDFERLAACFTETGVFVGAWATWTMRPQAHEFAEFVRNRTNVGEVRHFISHPLINVEGNTATAVTALLMTRLDGDGRPTVELTGEYHDLLTLVDGQWLFERRTVVVDGSDFGPQ
jgi:hypothetical protein